MYVNAQPTAPFTVNLPLGVLTPNNAPSAIPADILCFVFIEIYFPSQVQCESFYRLIRD